MLFTSIFKNTKTYTSTSMKRKQTFKNNQFTSDYFRCPVMPRRNNRVMFLIIKGSTTKIYQLYGTGLWQALEVHLIL